jgi:hypothetical protein
MSRLEPLPHDPLTHVRIWFGESQVVFDQPVVKAEDAANDLGLAGIPYHRMIYEASVDEPGNQSWTLFSDELDEAVITVTLAEAVRLVVLDGDGDDHEVATHVVRTALQGFLYHRREAQAAVGSPAVSIREMELRAVWTRDLSTELIDLMRIVGAEEAEDFFGPYERREPIITDEHADRIRDWTGP